MTRQRWVPYQGVAIPKARKKATKKRGNPERDEVHLPLMAWANKQWFGKCLLHIANERKCSPAQGALLRALGVRRGASDLFLAVPRNGFGGYWLELKASGKKPSEEQASWLTLMSTVGYQVGWFDDWEKAKASIENYLHIP